MSAEEKIDKICEMFKELIKLNAIEESEIERLNEYISFYEDLSKKQNKEIERLKEEYVMLQNASDEVEEELQQRIDKAIEYANKIPTQKVIRVFKKEILDILEGK